MSAGYRLRAAAIALLAMALAVPAHAGEDDVWITIERAAAHRALAGFGAAGRPDRAQDRRGSRRHRHRAHQRERRRRSGGYPPPRASAVRWIRVARHSRGRGTRRRTRQRAVAGAYAGSAHELHHRQRTRRPGAAGGPAGDQHPRHDCLAGLVLHPLPQLQQRPPVGDLDPRPLAAVRPEPAARDRRVLQPHGVYDPAAVGHHDHTGIDLSQRSGRPGRPPGLDRGQQLLHQPRPGRRRRRLRHRQPDRGHPRGDGPGIPARAHGQVHGLRRGRSGAARLRPDRAAVPAAERQRAPACSSST